MSTISPSQAQAEIKMQIADIQVQANKALSSAANELSQKPIQPGQPVPEGTPVSEMSTEEIRSSLNLNEDVIIEREHADGTGSAIVHNPHGTLTLDADARIDDEGVIHGTVKESRDQPASEDSTTLSNEVTIKGDVQILEDGSSAAWEGEFRSVETFENGSSKVSNLSGRQDIRTGEADLVLEDTHFDPEGRATLSTEGTLTSRSDGEGTLTKTQSYTSTVYDESGQPVETLDFDMEGTASAEDPNLIDGTITMTKTADGQPPVKVEYQGSFDGFADTVTSLFALSRGQSAASTDLNGTLTTTQGDEPPVTHAIAEGQDIGVLIS